MCKLFIEAGPVTGDRVILLSHDINEGCRVLLWPSEIARVTNTYFGVYRL